MTPRLPGFVSRNIVVADDDKAVINRVIETLLNDGHAVFQAYDGLSALQLALNLKVCHLVISNTRVGGKPGVDLIQELRARLPELPILYLANDGRSNLEVESQLPWDVPILREPFGADDLREAVRALLPPNRNVSTGT
jgi:two-component system, response regulator FlrC